MATYPPDDPESQLADEFRTWLIDECDVHVTLDVYYEQCFGDLAWEFREGILPPECILRVTRHRLTEWYVTICVASDADGRGWFNMPTLEEAASGIEHAILYMDLADQVEIFKMRFPLVVDGRLGIQSLLDLQSRRIDRIAAETERAMRAIRTPTEQDRRRMLEDYYRDQHHKRHPK